MKYVTTVPEGLYNISFFLVMNKTKWDSISKADREAIERVSGEAFARRAGRVWDTEDKLALELMAKNSVEITRMDGKFREEVAARLAEVRNEWLESAGKHGVDGSALLDKFRREYQALAK